MSRWKMEAPCAACPFSESKEGRQLRDSLGSERIRGIEKDLRRDKHFLCHKTTRETGNGTNLVCAGALAWQEARGLTSQYQRVCERLDSMFSHSGSAVPSHD